VISDGIIRTKFIPNNCFDTKTIIFSIFGSG